ncbi:MAG: hypothetical protein FJ006_03950 [Chloroflexi bacterium]|nr:hypothetical protein [Chloroflexota bacterium]
MSKFDYKVLIGVVLAIIIVALPLSGCAKQPPPPPPPPPSPGTIAVDPAKINYATLNAIWPKVAAGMKIPEAAVPKFKPAIALLGMPIKFTGTGWEPGAMVVVELVIPENVQMPGLDREAGEDAVGLAFAEADSAGNFEATVEAANKLNFLLRTGWTPLIKPDLTKVDPLPAGVYTVRALSMQPGSNAATITWELELVPSQ